ncbi:hypothetical protein BJ973_002223 [Actinoplanes tereljensis]|uniref:Integral membrane protein n=1 Tax=Paractinoplanes tereljensis TaxID=571912 RepID=A0A919NPW3_9ACTN|nr:hypothetical protein [Actinoplanes tereljensis]GIF21896.1 hypothetical protein Ate02nite_46260 [Actinoplanes tereljensis]
MTYTEAPVEIERLRAELATLQGRLDDRRRREFALLSLRRVAAAVFITITAFALVASVVGLWAATTVLSTGRWVSTVAPLPKDPQVATAVAEYTTTQVFEVLDVQRRITEVLPQQAAFVAGPITGQLRQAVDRTVTNVLQSDGFQGIWIELNRRAHQRVLAIVEDRSEVIGATADHVDIDLLPLINQVLRNLSAQLPTLFGKQITLPDLSSGEIPDNLRARVQDALGVPLPANFAQFTIYDAGRLAAVQESVATAKRSLAIFVTLTVVLLALALIISTGRRRTILQLGLGLVVAAVAVRAVLRGVRADVLAGVPEGVYRDGVAAAMTSVFGLLRLRGQQLLWIGAVLAVVAYLAGPGRGAVWLRSQVRRGALHIGRPSPRWIAAHLDVLRVGGLVLAAIVALLLSSWTSLFVVVVLLAVYEVGVTLLARDRSLPSHDAPDAPAAAG